MGRKPLIALLIAASGVILPAAALADTKAGVDAWTRGEFVLAIREWQAAALKGDADALFNLGQAYKLGKGVTQDLTKAEELFGRAAAMGHMQAADNYGLLLFQRAESYKKAAGTKVDPRVAELKAKALPFIRAAADRGDPRAQYLLGLAHFNGEQVPKDWVRAYALVSLARNQGLTLASPALQQMDEYIPLEQRQQAVQLAAELQTEADATRARQMAAVDLGSQVPNGGTAYSPPPIPVRQPPVITAAPPPAPRPASAAPPPTPRPAAVTPAPRPAAAQTGTWRIQLGAFGQAANADALWVRVKGRPELAGHPRLNVKAGAVTKLQAGGFASQAAAQAACAKLKAAGFECVATAG
jgi:cell division septation protein DedD